MEITFDMEATSYSGDVVRFRIVESKTDKELRRITAMKASYAEKSDAFIDWLPQAVEAINAKAQLPNPPTATVKPGIQ